MGFQPFRTNLPRTFSNCSRSNHKLSEATKISATNGIVCVLARAAKATIIELARSAKSKIGLTQAKMCAVDPSTSRSCCRLASNAMACEIMRACASALLGKCSSQKAIRPFSAGESGLLSFVGCKLLPEGICHYIGYLTILSQVLKKQLSQSELLFPIRCFGVLQVEVAR